MLTIPYSIAQSIVYNHDVNVLQADLNNIALWCKNNFMSLNISQCKLMHITRSRKLIATNYVISGQPLEAVKCYKYLGFIASCDLCWTSHVRRIVAKCSKLSGFIRRIVNSRNPLILKKLFCSLCRSILEYGIPVWLPHQKRHIQSIEAVQRRFTPVLFFISRGKFSILS